MATLNFNEDVFINAYRPYLFDYKHRREIYFGGSGSGKSQFVAQKLILKLLTKPRGRVALILRKYGSTIRNSTWANVLQILSDWSLLDKCKVNLTNYEIILPTHSTIIFKGLDDSEKIKSIAGITDIWLEEATEFTLDEFTQLDLRLRTKKSDLQMYLTLNPVSKASWIYQLYFSEDVQEDPQTFILKTTYKDNPYLPESYIKTIEELIKTNPTYYKVYAKGEWASLGKLVYTNFRLQNEHDIPIGTLICGLDFGFVNDPSAFITARVDDVGKVIYIIDEHYETGMLNSQIVDMIKRKGYAKEQIIADSADPKSIEEIRRAGIPRIKASVKGPDSIRYGIQRLQNYLIVVSPRCPKILEELNNYEYRKDRATGEYIDEPEDSYNHGLDALRYAMQLIDDGHRLKTMTKTTLGIH